VRVIIYRDYGTLTTKIIFVEKQLDKRFVHNLYTQQMQEIKDCEEIPDEFIMKVPDHLSLIFLKKFAEAIDEQGIKTDMDAKIEGTLEATKYHLEDLRKLLKL